jgi:hypothetical protein
MPGVHLRTSPWVGNVDSKEQVVSFAGSLREDTIYDGQMLH